MRRWTSALVVVLLAAFGSAQGSAPAPSANLVRRCERLLGKASFALGPTRPMFSFNRHFFATAELGESALSEISLQPSWFLLNRTPTDEERQWAVSDAEAASFLKKVDTLQSLGRKLKSEWKTSSGTVELLERYERANVTSRWDVMGTRGRNGPLQEIVVHYN